MVKCPVCEKNFNSEFALKGHVRLSRDPEHIAYIGTIRKNNESENNLGKSNNNKVHRK